jgi:hypothetical protein
MWINIVQFGQGDDFFNVKMWSLQCDSETWQMMEGYMSLVALQKPIIENTRHKVKQKTNHDSWEHIVHIVFVCK